jgi:hypothetical protein
MLGFDAPGFQPPAILPDGLITATALTRPVLAAGGAPRAVALLLEVEARGLVSALIEPAPIAGAVWTPSAFPARGAILLEGVLAAAAAASPLGLLQLDAGGDDFRIVADIPAGGSTVRLRVVAAGVTLATLAPAGALVVGVLRVLVAWAPTAVTLATSAGGLATATVPRPAGLYRGLIGNAAADLSLPFGGALSAGFLGFYPSAAEAAAIVAG